MALLTRKNREAVTDGAIDASARPPPSDEVAED